MHAGADVASIGMNEPQTEPATSTTAVGFFGPFGSFTEQALRSQPDLAPRDLVPFASVPDVLDAVTGGLVELGFVPIENSIEGTVNFTQDALAFDHNLLIQREVVLDIEHCLVGVPGATVDGLKAVLSIPVATAQCHHFLRRELPDAEVRQAPSTSDAARQVAEDGRPEVAAIASRQAAELYGLDVLLAHIEDHSGNQTRFVLVGRSGVPAPTGYDRTALVVYQRADEPGSLISILQEFAARSINLSLLLSRPTKTSLGDYCFLLDLDGHVSDPVVADCLRTLKATQGGVKFLGSYPAAGPAGPATRAEVESEFARAEEWLDDIRDQIR